MQAPFFGQRPQIRYIRQGAPPPAQGHRSRERALQLFHHFPVVSPVYPLGQLPQFAHTFRPAMPWVGPPGPALQGLNCSTRCLKERGDPRNGVIRRRPGAGRRAQAGLPCAAGPRPDLRRVRSRPGRAGSLVSEPPARSPRGYPKRVGGL